MRPADTSEAAWEAYWERLREMTPAEKVNMVAEMWAVADSLQRASMRQRFPEADEEEITYRIAVARYGEELARKAYRR